MALTGQLVGNVEISSGKDGFHNIMKRSPSYVASIFPGKIHGYDFSIGQQGFVGSTISWDYTFEGKRQTSKHVIEGVDEAMHKIEFKVVGGELVEKQYNTLNIILHVKPKAEAGAKQLVTWILDFERANTGVPYPTSLMDYLCGIILDLDAHFKTK